MAIRFVDKDPEDEPDRKAISARSKDPERSPVIAEPAFASPPSGAEPVGDDRIGPGKEATLPYPKPSPKVRGSKRPPIRAATPLVEPAQVSLAGLLPDLPHAKPEPKPRGRKKAFG